MAEQDREPEVVEPEPATVEMRGVRKVFGDVVALESVDLTIRTGEIIGIIGPSGSGKTTAIRLMLGIGEPTSGEVRVFGRDPARFSRSDRERIGYLPQHFVLYPDLTVSQNLGFIAGTYGLGWFRRRRRIPALLDMVRLTEAKGRLAQDISGGMQRRLALAAALVHDPELIVLDEPTAGLDPMLRSDVWDMFRELQSRGRTLVVTTQYVTEAEYCDRVELIDAGKVIAFGKPDELRRQAYGGDLVRLTVPGLDRPLVEEITGYPFVVSSERAGEDSLILVVEQAREAIPLLTDRLNGDGHSLTSIEEYREPFDQVFVRLVEQGEGGGGDHNAQAA